MAIPAAINELMDPTFNGSGLVNVIIAASGAQYRARSFNHSINGGLFSDYPEFIDYGLLLKKIDNTTEVVREFDSGVWQSGTLETYIGMPESYRSIFSGIREYVNNITGSTLDSRIPLTFISGIIADGDLLITDSVLFTVSRSINREEKKKFTGGMNLTNISGSVDNYNFIGGSQPTSLLYDSTYNGSALPELIIAFNGINPSGTINIRANPSQDINNDTVNLPSGFGWIAVNDQTEITTINSSPTFNLVYSKGTTCTVDVIIPIIIESGVNISTIINTDMVTGLDTPITVPSVLGLSPSSQGYGYSFNILVELYDNNFNLISEIYNTSNSGSTGINSREDRQYNTSFIINGNGMAEYIRIRSQAARSSDISYSDVSSTISFDAASGYIVGYTNLIPGLRHNLDFRTTPEVNSNNIIWSGQIIGLLPGSGIISNYD